MFQIVFYLSVFTVLLLVELFQRFIKLIMIDLLYIFVEVFVRSGIHYFDVLLVITPTRFIASFVVFADPI